MCGSTPETYLIDFELAVIKAAQTVFGKKTRISGCYFHFKQAIFKKVMTNDVFKETGFC